MTRLIKSLLDKSVAAIILLLVSPMMMILAIAVYWKMGSPVIFAQDRPGKNNRIFKFYKFRTITLTTVNNKIFKSNHKLQWSIYQTSS